MLSEILFITNLVKKFYNAFAMHKANGEQASITKILLTGIFGILSQTLTQLIVQIKEDENHYSDDNNTFNRNNNSRTFIQKFRRHSTDLPHITDHIDNNEPIDVYIDTNYKHYKTTIRRTEKKDYNYEHWKIHRKNKSHHYQNEKRNKNIFEQ